MAAAVSIGLENKARLDAIKIEQKKQAAKQAAAIKCFKLLMKASLSKRNYSNLYKFDRHIATMFYVYIRQWFTAAQRENKKFNK
jgi:hypothetical protein